MSFMLKCSEWLIYNIHLYRCVISDVSDQLVIMMCIMLCSKGKVRRTINLHKGILSSTCIPYFSLFYEEFNKCTEMDYELMVQLLHTGRPHHRYHNCRKEPGIRALTKLVVLWLKYVVIGQPTAHAGLVPKSVFIISDKLWWHVTHHGKSEYPRLQIRYPVSQPKHGI